MEDDVRNANQMHFASNVLVFDFSIQVFDSRIRENSVISTISIHQDRLRASICWVQINPACACHIFTHQKTVRINTHMHDKSLVVRAQRRGFISGKFSLSSAAIQQPDTLPKVF